MIVYGLLCFRPDGGDQEMLSVYSTLIRAQAFIDAQPSELRKWLSITKIVLDGDPLDEAWKKFARTTATIAELTAQLEAGITKSGETQNLDRKRWVSDWMTRANALLGNKRPEELLGTEQGRRALQQLIGRIQSGVYS